MVEIVDSTALMHAAGASYCEWKGEDEYWALASALPRADAIGWSYPRPLPACAEIADYYSFYPAKVECFVDGERVRPQPGEFHGGWVTDEVVGPFKGDPGTGRW